MNKSINGCWPTMITPFTDDNKIDFEAVKNVTDWYINAGCDGIFAVCQSSEMFFLGESEKIDLAKAVVDAAAGRVKVIASGHTADEKSRQIDELGNMAGTGVDAVILVSNRLAEENESDEVLESNFENIIRQLPGIKFGIYECPYPYLRLLSTDFIGKTARNGTLLSIKDVSCNVKTQKERIAAVKGTPFALLNANTATLLDFLEAGGDGYNGVMGNFHMDLYKWLYLNHKSEPELSRELSDFLTLAAVIESRAYPVSAKYHFSVTGVPMGLHTRAKSKSILNENACLEVKSLIRMEDRMRKKLGVSSLKELTATFR